jgi:hypothetical protein
LKRRNFPKRIGRCSGPVRFVFVVEKRNEISELELICAVCFTYRKGIGGFFRMLVERGLQVMNVEVVGDAYAIASNYLRRSGVIADNFVTNDRLLGLIVQMFRRGEYNKLRLANRAIAAFEAGERA